MQKVIDRIRARCPRAVDERNNVDFTRLAAHLANRLGRPLDDFMQTTMSEWWLQLDELDAMESHTQQPRDSAAPSGLAALRAKHPCLLAKPGPCAVLRVLLADPQKLWSARGLAKSDDMCDALPAGKADARSVGRWLAELRGAGLACAEGRGTAKRWRLGAA